MDEPEESTGSQLRWFATSSLRELLGEAAFFLVVGAVIVVPAVIGYAVAGSDGIVPGLAVGVGICAIVLLWWLVTGARDLRRRWKGRSRGR